MMVPTLNTELSKKCKRFVMAHWGMNGLKHVKERPVSWVRHEANPHLKVLRRRGRALPLIAVHGAVNRIYLTLSTEQKAVR
ncbi:MAG: hypothetical protein HY595_01770 [Candidatus Omnitrophica bacterium]|nr:hypothetical protein [Candidatus Omnitrophota bacterium]